ncbi:hypothetical protein AAC387_Pa11g0302 [Persea americana]
MAAEAVLSSVLEVLLNKLSSSNQNALGSLLGIEKEKRKLESNLSAIKAVLQDAERRQVNEMAVKDWLRKLKDAAYDAEDLVDKLVVKARRKEVENQDGRGKKVRTFFSTSNPLASNFKMKCKMQELMEQFDDIAKERERYQFKERDVQSQPFIPSTRETDSLVNESLVYGRDYEKNCLIYSLIHSGKESVLSIIPIVGMGGVGKTTLAQLVYNDESVVSHFELRMWVYVSEDFDVRRLLKEILQSAIKEKTEQLSMDLLQTHLQEKLGGKRYLLVLDDVWNDVPDQFFEKWERLKTWLACGSMGSKVLVTSRDDQVAGIMHTLPTLYLGILSTGDSWRFFEKLVNPEQNLPQNLLSIGKEMVGKCGGLPLAVKTLGGLMSSKKTESEWEYVKNSEFWKPQDSDGRVLSILRLSYDRLTSSLKQCFAYCAVIPKGDLIDKDRLVKQWIAQGFIHSNKENELLEEKGEGFFKELLRRSLFQVDMETNDINKELYKMHDLIHDLLKSVVEKECFIVKASIDTIPRETRHLTLRDGEWVREPKNLKALKNCKKLRSLFLPNHFVDTNAFLSLRYLRVLELCNSNIYCLPNSIDRLRGLRYLDISYTWITELPETICNLHSLQTLKVLHIPLKKLPKNMKRMINLRHIEFDRGDDFPLPKGIGELTHLRTLPRFVVSKESEAGIEELKGLNQLRGHIWIKGLDNIRNGAIAREADLRAKQHVNSLSLSWSDDETIAIEEKAVEVIDNLKPHSNLKILAVEKYMGPGFPSWMTKKLTNLVEISLSDCNRCEHLPPLGQLPFLESLEIDTMDAAKYIVQFDGSRNYKDLFPSLNYLDLSNMPNLEGWSSPQEDGDGDEQGRGRDERLVFKCLRTLRIHNCPKLTQPPRLPLLPSIESLQIKGMSWDIIEIPTSNSLREIKLDEMPNLEIWSLHEDELVTLPSLCTLSISNCPKLTNMPDLERRLRQEADDDDKQMVFPSLSELVVQKCPRMARLPHLLHSLEKLKISESNEMLLGSVVNYTSIFELSITGLPEVEQLPEELGRNLTGLYKLKIINCPKLTSLSNQLENLLYLGELTIEGCNDLVLSLPDGLQLQQRSPPLDSLEVLKIINSCEKQTSLPGDGIVLPSLRRLEIDSCENIESLSADMLQNLTDLSIAESSKVWSSLVSLENLKSLQFLTISGCPKPVMMKLLESAKNLTSLVDLWIENCPGMRSLPESIKTLTSLTDLTISECHDMSSLPEWVGDLTLLEYLYIEDCPGMKSLPEGLQRLRNVQVLHIKGCPLLETKLQHNKEQEWHKVANVPAIVIGEESDISDCEGEESSD